MYKKTIIIVNLCFLGDIAYSTENDFYGQKHSQKNTQEQNRGTVSRSQNKALLSMKKKNLLK